MPKASPNSTISARELTMRIPDRFLAASIISGGKEADLHRGVEYGD